MERKAITRDNWETEITQRLDAIWNGWNPSSPELQEIKKRDFLAPKSVEENSLLFIGINPSWNKKNPKKNWNERFYTLNQNKGDIDYFNKFIEITEYCNHNVEENQKIKSAHLDLCYFRETNQDTINQILDEETGIPFIYEQLTLTNDLIKAVKPRVIVVCNALAATFFGKYKTPTGKKAWLDYPGLDKINEDLGVHVSTGIPIFFSGMLSGQRALDLGSLERLKWHIKRTIKLIPSQS